MATSTAKRSPVLTPFVANKLRQRFDRAEELLRIDPETKRIYVTLPVWEQIKETVAPEVFLSTLPLPEPTDELPGTHAHNHVLRERHRLGQQLHHPDDAVGIGEDEELIPPPPSPGNYHRGARYVGGVEGPDATRRTRAGGKARDERSPGERKKTKGTTPPPEESPRPDRRRKKLRKGWRAYFPPVQPLLWDDLYPWLDEVTVTARMLPDSFPDGPTHEIQATVPVEAPAVLVPVHPGDAHAAPPDVLAGGKDDRVEDHGEATVASGVGGAAAFPQDVLCGH